MNGYMLDTDYIAPVKVFVLASYFDNNVEILGVFATKEGVKKYIIEECIGDNDGDIAFYLRNSFMGEGLSGGLDCYDSIPKELKEDFKNFVIEETFQTLNGIDRMFFPLQLWEREVE